MVGAGGKRLEPQLRFQLGKRKVVLLQRQSRHQLVEIFGHVCSNSGMLPSKRSKQWAISSARERVCLR